MTNNIKKMYSNIINKKKFIELVAKKLDKNPVSIKNHWFTGFFKIPEEEQEAVVELLQNTIKKQINKQQQLLLS